MGTDVVAKSSNHTTQRFPAPYVRLCEDIEHGDTLGGLRRVQVVQSGHGVDDAKHYSCLYPVIHQVGVRQTSCRRNKTCFLHLGAVVVQEHECVKIITAQGEVCSTRGYVINVQIPPFHFLVTGPLFISER